MFRTFNFVESKDLMEYAPYAVVIDTAVAMLDDAIAIMASNRFTVPGSADWINGQSMSGAELARLADSYAARFIANSARPRAGRAAGDGCEGIRGWGAGRL